MEDTWLQNLKAGDPVIVRHSGIGRTADIEAVERTTATQIIVRGRKYSRDRGSEMGRSSKWSWSRLAEATSEAVSEIRDTKRHGALAHKLNEMRWRDLPLEVLEAVDAVLEEAKENTHQ